MAKASLRSVEVERLKAEWTAIWAQIRALPCTDQPDGNNARPGSPAYLVLEALSRQVATRHRRAMGGWGR